MNAKQLEKAIAATARSGIDTIRDDASDLHLRKQGARWTWSIRYRAHGHRRRVTLGEYPRVSLAAARLQASRVLRRVDIGEDPQAAKKNARAAAERAKKDSIEALCTAYIEEYAKPQKRTWRDDQSKLTCEILPKWKRRAVTSITRDDCQDLIEAIAKRGAPIYANRITALLSKLFGFAIHTRIITANPAWKLPKPGVEVGARPEGEHEQKPYSEDEIRRIWQNTEPLPVSVKAPIRLGLLTGQRPTECRDLEWSEVDGSWWTLPPSRTKNKRTQRVYLVPTALDLLAHVPRVDDEPKAFAGYRGKRQLAEWNRKAFAGVTRRQKPRHALRDTVATGLAACGVDAEDISKVLNHAYGPRVTAGYNAYSYDKEKQRALGKWAKTLASILAT